MRPSEPSFKQVYQRAHVTLQGLKETNFAFQLLIKLGLPFIMPPKRKNSSATQQPPAKRTRSSLSKRPNSNLGRTNQTSSNQTHNLLPVDHPVIIKPLLPLQGQLFRTLRRYLYYQSLCHQIHHRTVEHSFLTRC